jgi:hypothetical protein
MARRRWPEADRTRTGWLIAMAALLALIGVSCGSDLEPAGATDDESVQAGPGDGSAPDDGTAGDDRGPGEDRGGADAADLERRREPPTTPGTDEDVEPGPPTEPPDEEPPDERPAGEPEPDEAIDSGRVRLLEAQQLLTELGHPVGPVDGVEGPLTRRGLCTWRRLTGQHVTLDGLQPQDLDRLRDTRHPMPAPDGRGVTVDKTCQAVYVRDGGTWLQVHHASTGEGGLPRPGDYTISRKREGWHTSSLYPAPEPNMYNAMYFHGAIAIHGSNHVPPHPASAGCVRVTPSAADHLFTRLAVGDPVTVIGQR